jgi:hypothetical protein
MNIIIFKIGLKFVIFMGYNSSKLYKCAFNARSMKLYCVRERMAALAGNRTPFEENLDNENFYPSAG